MEIFPDSAPRLSISDWEVPDEVQLSQGVNKGIDMSEAVKPDLAVLTVQL
uniref:Uncharacterized protein n=1 Tax=Ochrobactrum sp. SJY1 TaxID=1526653 RepID=A0A075X8N1_9HYPH|nr:hypothetical protein [Ochrobactrum sp. SJY1]